MTVVLRDVTSFYGDHLITGDILQDASSDYYLTEYMNPSFPPFNHFKNQNKSLWIRDKLKFYFNRKKYIYRILTHIIQDIGNMVDPWIT